MDVSKRQKSVPATNLPPENQRQATKGGMSPVELLPKHGKRSLRDAKVGILEDGSSQVSDT